MKEKLSHAIDAHHAWAQTFTQAIENCEANEAVRRAAYDDLCVFGQWLYGLDDAVKMTSGYRRVKNLHYEFHVEAGVIAGLLERREYDTARNMLGADFFIASEKLRQAIEDWRTELD